MWFITYVLTWHFLKRQSGPQSLKFMWPCQGFQFNVRHFGKINETQWADCVIALVLPITKMTNRSLFSTPSADTDIVPLYRMCYTGGHVPRLWPEPQNYWQSWGRRLRRGLLQSCQPRVRPLWCQRRPSTKKRETEPRKKYYNASLGGMGLCVSPEICKWLEARLWITLTKSKAALMMIPPLRSHRCLETHTWRVLN